MHAHDPSHQNRRSEHNLWSMTLPCCYFPLSPIWKSQGLSHYFLDLSSVLPNFTVKFLSASFGEASLNIPIMLKSLRRWTYYNVSEVEDSKALMSDSSSSLELRSNKQSARNKFSPWLIVILLALFSMLTFIVGFYIGRLLPSHLDATCTKHVSKYCKYHPIIYSGLGLIC